MKIEYWTSPDGLESLTTEWVASMNGETYGIDVKVDTCIEDMRKTLEYGNGVLIVLLDDKPVGVLAVFKMQSLTGDQEFGIEKCWYVSPAYRRYGIKLIKEAEKWCRKEKCSHMAMAASNLVSDLHDKVCDFYKRQGMKLFETTYIKELG